MRLLKFALWALLAGLYFVPMQAIAGPGYACSVAEIFECTAVAGCQRVSAAQANLPPFVTLDVKQKRLFSGLFGGEGLFEPGDVYEDPNVLILHGRHGLLTWSAVVDKATESNVHVDRQFGQDLRSVRKPALRSHSDGHPP